MNTRASAWLRRAGLILVFYVAAPLLLLGLLEGALRLSGFGTSTSWLLERQCGEEHFHSPNPAFYQQFSALPLPEIMNWDELEFLVPPEKAATTFRIFAFGESAIYGKRSAVRILDAMLAARFPAVKFEVFNVACPGMNSHVLRAAAREAAEHQPDLFLIYMGNNEAVGPYGPNTLLGHIPVLWNPAVIQTLIRAHNLRLVQWMERLARRPVGPPTLAQIQASVPGQTDYSDANSLYAQNLEAMLGTARDAGIGTVLCTLSSNRAFGGEAPERPASPEDIVRGALGKIVLELAAARADEAVYLADVDRYLHEHSPSGVPDYTFFTDNIHLSFDGAHQVASAMYDAVVKSMPADLRGATPPPPLTRDEAALRLGWNAAAEIELLRIQVKAGFDEPSKKLLGERLARLEPLAPADLNAAIAADCAKALELRPEDIYLHRSRFEALLFGNQGEAALAEAQEMVRLFPCARLSLRAMAQALNATARFSEAQDAYRRTLAVYPDDVPSLASLAVATQP